jgi:beta-galactosidase/beta-glucuronidase
MSLLCAVESSSEKRIIQSEACRLGLRSVAIAPTGILTLNDRPVTIRGVNLHEHDPAYGHTITPQLLEADILLLKRHNFNAVRTSHYPQTPWFYELCTGATCVGVTVYFDQFCLCDSAQGRVNVLMIL